MRSQREKKKKKKDEKKEKKIETQRIQQGEMVY
jgi:hypothetical protein